MERPKEYPNDDVTVNLELDGDYFELKRHNTEIFRFLGKFAIFNHIYHAPDDEESVLYLFEEVEQIKKLVQYLIERKFPLHENIIEPLITDIETYIEMALDQLSDDIEDFEENGME